MRRRLGLVLAIVAAAFSVAAIWVAGAELIVATTDWIDR